MRWYRNFEMEKNINKSRDKWIHVVKCGDIIGSLKGFYTDTNYTTVLVFCIFNR